MNFNKDILVIDTELTGLDPKKHEIIQLAAILLDKKTLKEKEVFNAYVRPSKWKQRDPESMKVNGILWDQLKDAPSLKKVLGDFNRMFGHNVIQAFYVGFNDKRFLLQAYEKAKIKWQFDYHYLELWGLIYPFLAAKNKLTNRKKFTGFEMEDLIKMFKIKIGEDQLHDALVDCRVEAEILRKVIKEL